ncbi:MAG: hypothetical protein K8T90_12995 [Planctomycetes bacterium]|nr:hypothetical protein [Planctomycetota bacterium]
MSAVTCTEFEASLTDLVTGAGLDAAGAAAFEDHARACPPCARQLRRERALVRRLDAMGVAPHRDLPVPGLLEVRRPFLHTLPRLPGGRRTAATAAACLVAGAALAAYFGMTVPRGPAAGAGGSASNSETARRDDVSPLIVDDANPFPAWDDRLLGLTAGAEHLAARQPPEAR